MTPEQAKELLRVGIEPATRCAVDSAADGGLEVAVCRIQFYPATTVRSISNVKSYDTR